MTTARLGDSGIVLGEVDEYGVMWSLQAEGGLFGNSPSVRDNSGDRAVADGTWNATRFFNKRAWSPKIVVTAPDHDKLHHARARIEAAVGVDPFLVTGDEPFFGTRYATFRRDGEALFNEDADTAEVSLSMVADDPLIRGVEQTSATGAPSSSGGLVWPATWPATWDATVTSGRLNLVNEGNRPASIRWRIDGPVTEPFIINTDTGERLSTTLILGAGEWVTIDTATHRVLAADDPQASRRTSVYGDWFAARPGTTGVQFGATSPGPGATLTARWASTWI